MSKGMQIAGGASVIALLFVWYASSRLEDGTSFAYFQHLQEFQASAASFAGRHARVHGYVAVGSIERDVDARRVSFRVQNDPPHAGGAPGPTLEVVYASLETPDLFKDGAEVVVEGIYSGGGPGGIFHADRVMAKCPSKFEAGVETEAAADQTASF